MDQLAGKTAVVTGGASGIGLAMARRFAQEGMSVVLGDIDAAALDAAQADLPTSGGSVTGFVCDVTDRSSLDGLREAALEATGAVHVVCLNAGVAPSGRILDTSIESWRWVVEVNLFGVVNGVDAFGPGLVAQGEGHLVLTASAAGLIASPFLGAYGATKHAVVGMATILHDELAPEGVGVSVVCPGTVATPIFESERNRPAALAGTSHADQGVIEMYRQVVAASMSPQVVADAVLQAVRDGDLFVLPSPELDALIEHRHQQLADAMARRDARAPTGT